MVLPTEPLPTYNPIKVVLRVEVYSPVDGAICKHCSMNTALSKYQLSPPGTFSKARVSIFRLGAQVNEDHTNVPNYASQESREVH